jgi:hypothetical protein
VAWNVQEVNRLLQIQMASRGGDDDAETKIEIDTKMKGKAKFSWKKKREIGKVDGEMEIICGY